MRAAADVQNVLALLAQGLNDCEVSRRSGVPRPTVRQWRTQGPPGQRPLGPEFLPMREYAYLLGLYLGDGYLAAHPRGVYALRIALDQRYPGIVNSCAEAMALVIGKPASLAWAVGCVEVKSYSKRWPELFPQHGPGRKHERPIVLEDWQQAIVDLEPECFLKGLIHSDGCRSMNTIRHPTKTYAYPRYSFCNVSDDIRRLFTDTCDKLGIEWRTMNAKTISIAKRASVAELDRFVGPKW